MALLVLSLNALARPDATASFFWGGEVWIEHLKLEDVQSGGFVEIAGENAATYTVNRNDQKKRIQVAISE